MYCVPATKSTANQSLSPTTSRVPLTDEPISIVAFVVVLSGISELSGVVGVVGVGVVLSIDSIASHRAFTFTLS